MREILFRGKDINTGKWCYGYLSKFRDETIIVCEGGRVWNYVLDETVGQYTGLKDKNGKMIFEGDIIEVFGDLSRVYWSNGNSSFKFQKNNSCIEGVGNYSSPAYLQIGNIYDNPELLGE